jgi:hypothetical protein
VVKLRLVTLLAIVVALPLTAGAATGFRAVFAAPTHTPKVKTRWPWSLKVTTAAGKPLAARITVQIVDPYGGVHPVEFGCCTKNITSHPIVGSFKDYVIWPPESAVGLKLQFQVVVRALGVKRVVRYWVTPK